MNIGSLMIETRTSLEVLQLQDHSRSSGSDDSLSEHEASLLPGLLLGAADDLPVGDHVERDGELLEDGHHVPVVLRAALHVRRAPRLLHLKSLRSQIGLGFSNRIKAL